jgi:NAD(P)-dependent dehydrogenase (short-subunit alcohol dehydrogenase family)
MGALDGKVAIVTGGGSGIGRAVVEKFVQEGARVSVLEKMPERVAELQSQLGSSGLAIQGDVTSMDDNERAVAETVRAFGQLDIFVGNAGIHDRSMTLEDMPSDQLGRAFDELIGINVKGCFMGSKAAIPELKKTEGCIIFTCSHAGFRAGGGGTLYTASKHAIVGLIKQLANELYPTVRVNGVAPAGVATDLRGADALGQAAPRETNPEQRARSQQPSDLAEVYLLLANPVTSKLITATVIDASGGTMSRLTRPGAPQQQQQATPAPAR